MSTRAKVFLGVLAGAAAVALADVFYELYEAFEHPIWFTLPLLF